MFRISRRSALGLVAVGMASTVAGVAAILSKESADEVKATGKLLSDGNPIKAENRLPGSQSWRKGADGIRVADDIQLQIKGYASVPSVNVGESIDFHVTVNQEQDFSVAIYRLGYYGGDGGRQVAVSPILHGVTQPAPDLDPATGMISCRWSSSWTLNVPTDWTSGAYLAAFTTGSGWRSFTPFVVRDDRRLDGLCVVLPFSTYQAYNQWPLDGKRGKSLYYGYEFGGEDAPSAASQVDGRRAYDERAFKVSFDRPYTHGGLPNLFDSDHDFIHWVERAGYNVTYATSIDLHTGRLDPSAYRGVIFCGHDEYWSWRMRDAATRAVAQGTSLAFMTANNIYWKVRFEPSTDGRQDRVMVCYKSATDPAADWTGATTRWRDIRPGAADAEQTLLGVQYNGILAAPEPLVVDAADHWFWAGSGVKNGDRIDKIVSGEADGLDPLAPRPEGVRQTLLSASPYQWPAGVPLMQNTSVYETTRGAVVFAASTLNWPLGLSRQGYEDDRIQTATSNLLNRMLRGADS